MPKSKSIELKRDGMSIFSKIFFTIIFLSMGLAIVGAGLRGAPATAPIVILIGTMMVIIGFAPYIIPLIYSIYVDPKKEAEVSKN